MHNETDEEVRATRNAQEAAQRGAFAPKPRPPILNYTILQSNDPEGLAANVRAHIKNGWAPLGNVTMYMQEENDGHNRWSFPMFVQALILRS